MNIDDLLGRERPKKIERRFTDMELAIMEGGGEILDDDIYRLREALEKKFERFVENQDYMAGHCHVMALALKKLHPGWQIRAHIGWDEDSEDDEDYRVDHIYIVAPDGSAYDCRGRFSNEQALVGPDQTGGVETQFVDYSINDIKQDIARGELKPIAKGDIDRAVKFASSIQENFADGKKPGRKGLAKRMGVDCGKSETALRKIAKNSSGERQRMAHWCANMKGGRK